MPSTSAGTASGGGTHVVMVHGTFAAGAPWTSPTSELSRALTARVPQVVLHTVDWGGQNSPSAREAASIVIRELIESLPRGDAVFIVAHSHGGNGALRAVTGVGRPVAGVVCLATPFINSSPRQIPESDPQITSDLFTALVWTPVLLYCFYKFLKFGVPIVEEEVRGTAIVWRNWMTVVLCCIGAIRFLADSLVANLMNHLRAFADKWSARLQTPLAPGCRTLVVRTTDRRDGTYDEAVLALRASRALVNAMFGLWGVLSRRRRPTCGCGCMGGPAALALALVTFAQISPTLPPLVMGELIWPIAAIAAAALAAAAVAAAGFIAVLLGGMLLLSVASLLLAAYGLRPLAWGARGEAALAPLVVDVAANTTPPFSADDLRLPRRGLLYHWLSRRELIHSVYLDPKVVDGVVSWILAQTSVDGG